MPSKRAQKSVPWSLTANFFVCFLCRRKLQNKLKASDEALTELQAKCASVDKAKNRMAAEFEDLNLDLEKARG